jgi:hypothetical protein
MMRHERNAMKTSKPRTKVLEAVRSTKAGRPPHDTVPTGQGRRRRKTATVAVKKDTMLMQAARGPRSRWPASRPEFKKS